MNNETEPSHGTLDPSRLAQIAGGMDAATDFLLAAQQRITEFTSILDDLDALAHSWEQPPRRTPGPAPDLDAATLHACATQLRRTVARRGTGMAPTGDEPQGPQP
jgi:hypothetical protein